MNLDRFADAALDSSLIGFSSLGPAVRRRLGSWPDDPRPGSLKGHTVLVTGAGSGLGTAAALQAAQLGAQVDLIVRDERKGRQAADQIDAAVGRSASTVWRCDLSDPDSIDAFVKAYLAAGRRPSGIVHNAGVMPPERSSSPFGHELTMAVHVLGPVRLTDGLIGHCAPGVRIVLVTSGGMYTQRLPVDDPDFEEGSYSGAVAYARSKRTQVDLLDRLQERWGTTAFVYAMHPGWVDTPGVSTSLPGFARVMGPVLRDADAGADTITWLLAHQPAPPSGFWHDRRLRPTHRLPKTRADDAAVEQMWRWVTAAATQPPQASS